MIIFIPFEPLLDRSTFDCGNASLNSWFREQCGQQAKANTARTTFGVDEKETRIASFYSLVTYRVDLEDLVGTRLGRRRRYPMPAVLLGRLAVDLDYQGTGLGRLTLGDALTYLAGVAAGIGFECVLVDAIDDAALEFYLKYGFTMLSDDGRRMFLRTDDLRATFGSVG